MARMLGKGEQGVSARVRGKRVTRGCAAWRLRRSKALQACAGGAARASEWDGRHPAIHPSQPSRTARLQPGPGLGGAPFPPAPSAPHFRDRGSAHSPTGGAPLSSAKRVWRFAGQRSLGAPTAPP